MIRAVDVRREYFGYFEDLDFQLRVGDACRVWLELQMEYLDRLHPVLPNHLHGWRSLVALAIKPAGRKSAL